MVELFTTTLLTDPSIKAYYRFSSGSILTDSSGNAQTLTDVGTVGVVPGKYGDSADLGAANSSKAFLLGNNVGITTTTISIVCWVKLSAEISSGEWTFVQHANDTSDTFYELRYEYNGGTRRVVAKGYRVGGGDAQVLSTYNVDLGTTTYHHLALTCDSTTQRLYVDGYERDSDSTVSAGSESFNNRLNIGRNYLPDGPYGDPGPDKYASAIIDDVAVFGKKLSDSEVLSLASGGFKPKVIIF